MDFDLYLNHMRRFHEVHGLPTDIPAVRDKLVEEVRELLVALAMGTIEEQRKEAADTFNVLCRLIDLLGGNPTLDGYGKLIEAAGRPEYVARRMDVAEGRETCG